MVFLNAKGWHNQACTEYQNIAFFTRDPSLPLTGTLFNQLLPMGLLYTSIHGMHALLDMIFNFRILGGVRGIIRMHENYLNSFHQTKQSSVNSNDVRSLLWVILQTGQNQRPQWMILVQFGKVFSAALQFWNGTDANQTYLR